MQLTNFSMQISIGRLEKFKWKEVILHRISYVFNTDVKLIRLNQTMIMWHVLIPNRNTLPDSFRVTIICSIQTAGTIKQQNSIYTDRS